ncbi:MAG: DUF6449 domain-containing protein [Clostridium sp.]|nr:DUF6449 domain-containing protein [Clostridium sp.]
MIYGNLFSKLLKEDLKRRIWAVALTFLAFFFSLPIGLALAMENAENTNYRMFNDYRPFINDGSMPDAQFREKLLSLRTDVVMSQAGFGSGLVAFLLIMTAVVIGVSSFSYLHNRQKVDFYHSIPVRREALFGSQFMGGILIAGLAYGINLLLLTVVALAYGVPLGNIAGPLAGGWALNMLYFMLMYATVAVAMMMTGHMVVGILATGIFFFFPPGILFLLTAYCETFFVTTARNMWSNEFSPFWWGIKYLSPFSIYMVALSWKLKDLGRHVPELFCSVAALLALILLALQLYRIRPSEAAGKAMAFKPSKAPIRMIMVIGFGLAGGIFFWVLQSRLKWGLFGVIVSVLLSHCIIEIIYHFDFKKLFANKIQLGIGLAVTVLIFLSFRFDWYGYDSYIPKESSVASVSLDVESDHEWSDIQVFDRNEEGVITMSYPPVYEYIEDNMKLTDMNAVMAIVQESRDRTLEGRELRLEGYRDIQMYSPSSSSYSVIGGADGPTSVFLAGKEEREREQEKFFTTVTVCYEMKDGRRIRREYQTIPLSAVMDAYSTVYNSQEYKTGVYSVFGQNPAEVCQVLYREAEKTLSADGGRGTAEEILSAYQADLMELAVEDRLKEVPVGRIGFVTDNVVKYMEQEEEGEQAVYTRGYGRDGYQYKMQGEQPSPANYIYFWPVYPSFTRTNRILEEQGVVPGSYFAPENADSVIVNVQPYLYRDDGSYGELPRGEALEELQRMNPYYREDGYLEITKQSDIKVMMQGMAQEDCFNLNYLYDSGEDFLRGMSCSVMFQGGRIQDCIFTGENVTPELMKLFKGISIEEGWNRDEY